MSTSVEIAIIQNRMEPGASDAYASLQTRLLIHRAALSGAGLVVLPTVPGHLLPGVSRGVRVENLPASSLPSEIIVSTLAAAEGIYLVAGPFLTERENGWQNVLALYAPDGSLTGLQGQTHLSREDLACGLVPDQMLTAWETAVGRIGLIVGEDVMVPAVGAILSRQGAQILITTTALAAPYHETAQLARLWREVQTQQLFGLEACVVGEIKSENGNTIYQGRSAVLAPCELTTGGKGFLTTTAENDTEEIITATLDFRAIRASRAASTFAQNQPSAFYKEALSLLY